LAELLDALGEVIEGGVQLVAFIQHAGHTNVGQAGQGLGVVAPVGGRQRLLEGGQRGTQVASGMLDGAEVRPRPRNPLGVTDRLPLDDTANQGLLGLGQPALQPVGHGQVPVRERAQGTVRLGRLG
jgi:hypothetical protein